MGGITQAGRGENTQSSAVSYLEDDANTPVDVLVVCSPESILFVTPLVRYSLVIVYPSVGSPLNQNRHLWPDTIGSIVSLWKESMCLANAALAAANLRDNLYIQPLIKEHSYAWMTSSKVPGGCGKRPASKCGLNRGPVLPCWIDYTDFKDTDSCWARWGSLYIPWPRQLDTSKSVSMKGCTFLLFLIEKSFLRLKHPVTGCFILSFGLLKNHSL